MTPPGLPMQFEPELEPCTASGMCPRLVSKGIRYCCGPCGDGWEATPRYEPAAHTDTCDARWAQRQPRKARTS